MTGKIHYDRLQNAEESFAFTAENLQQAQAIVSRYPTGKQQSAVLPLLGLAQKQNNNWLSKAAMDTVAHMLGMVPVRVYEVATFYTMYNLEQPGRHVIEICTTTPCWLRGSDEIVAMCEKKLGIGMGDTTADGNFTLREVECLGACVNAPMCAIGDRFYEDLTPENTAKLIDALSRGETPTPGPQSGRKSSEPASGRTTLAGSK